MIKIPMRWDEMKVFFWWWIADVFMQASIRHTITRTVFSEGWEGGGGAPGGAYTILIVPLYSP